MCTSFALILCSSFQFALAQAPPPLSHDLHPPPRNDTRQPPEVVCRPYGICQPCPKEELHQPFCQPFGNRRLMHCPTTTTTTPVDSSLTSSSHHGGKPHRNSHTSTMNHPPDHAGETPAWESCGRIVAQEHADFWEFVACNVFFALVSLALVVVRSRRLHALQTRQLAARIGLARASARHV